MAGSVFLSHASEDVAISEEIALAIRGAGLKVFLDDNDLPPAGDYHARIRNAIAQSDYFVFLVSPDSVAAGRYTLTELKLAQEKWTHPGNRVLPVIVRPTPMTEIPAYLKAVTMLTPRGSAAAEVASALEALTNAILDSALLEAASNALHAIHDLDNAIRTVLGPLTRFDHTWSNAKREETVSAVESLADAENVLPRIRQYLAQLDEASRQTSLTVLKGEAIAEVLGCGNAVLTSLGRSHVTPWPGPDELVTLLSSIRTAHTPENAAFVRQQVARVQSIVYRDRLGRADGLIGRWRGTETRRP
jgi:hypothetical protein